MHPRKHERRAKTGTSWWRLVQRHRIDDQRLKAMPETLQLGDGHTGAYAARIDEFALRSVIAE
jgi:hypothetical protein